MTKTMTVEAARGLLAQANHEAGNGDALKALALVAKVLRMDDIGSEDVSREAFKQGSRYMKELVDDGWVVIGVDHKSGEISWAKGPVTFI